MTRVKQQASGVGLAATFAPKFPDAPRVFSTMKARAYDLVSGSLSVCAGMFVDSPRIQETISAASLSGRADCAFAVGTAMINEVASATTGDAAALAIDRKPPAFCKVRNGTVGMICFLVSLASAGWVSAATFNVNTLSDTHAVNPSAGTGLDSTGKISLRSALEVVESIGGTQTINLPAGTYNLSLGTITFGDVAQNVSIAGASAATTIVNMTTTAQNRIFLIGTTGTLPNVHTTISNVQFTGGKLTGDNYGGGAIIAGGPSNSLTLTNCIFQNDTIAAAVAGAPGGGAVRYNGGGSLTITGSVFNNNTNPLSAGGAVDYFFENLVGIGNGVVTITNSTFTNNGVMATGATGGAVNIAAQGRITAGVTFTVSVLRNTFSGNSASGSSGTGGAISVTNSFDVGNTAQFNYNRIFANTSNAAPSAMAVSGGSQGNVDATDNWWGVNTGPGTTAAKLGAGGGTFSLGTWLQLRNSASPTSSSIGNTSTVTADILGRNSGGAIAASNLAGLPSFPAAGSAFSNPQKGTIPGGSVQFVGGVASVAFTGTSLGSGGVDATADSQTLTAAITITKANTTTTITNAAALATATAVGQSYPVAASVSTASGTPSGSINVSDGSVACTITLPATSCNLTSTTAGNKTVTATYSGDGNYNGSSTTNSHVVYSPANLSITKSHTGNFTQGTTGIWNLLVQNNASVASATTVGAVTVIDTLPAGYTVSSASGTNWTCTPVTQTVTCSSSQVIVGNGGQFSIIQLVVNIPANSPTSVTNNAKAFGGGDTTHTSAATGAAGSETVTVIQAPATIQLTAGNNQSVAVTAAFPTNLSVTVLDAGNAPISGRSTTFTAPASGASGTFANSSNTLTTVTNASGVATAGVFTANAIGGGPYNVSVTAGSAPQATFNLTNVAPPTVAVSKLVSVDNGATYSASSSAPPGTSLIYKLIASNSVTALASQVQFSDVLPAGVTIVSGSGKFATATATTYAAATSLTEGSGGYTAGAGSVAYNPGGATGTVAASGALVLFFKVTINNATTGTLTNNVSVNYNDAIGNAQTAATGSAAVTVQKANQTLTFGAPPGAPFPVDSTATVVASSANPNSGNAITYSSLTTVVCSVNSVSGLVAGVSIGACTIAANQLGNSAYNDAAQVTQSFAVSAACDLDINGDSGINADKDGVLLTRYLLGFRGASLIANVPLGAGRADAQAVENFIGSGSQYDVFGRVVLAPTAHRDGVVLIRIMLGVPDASLLGGMTVPAGATYTQGATVRANVNRRCGTSFLP